MTIALNHTIVPAHDKVASAQFYARIFGFAYDGPLGHFEPVTIAAQALTLDFDNAENFASHHYAFKVSEAEFDEISTGSRPRISPTAADRARPRMVRSTVGAAVAGCISATPTAICSSC